MKYDELMRVKIAQNIDEEYCKFHAGVVPGVEVKGVRVPVLRQIAKEFSVYDDFLANITLDSYEAVCVACYYVGNTTKDLELLQKRLAVVLPLINNWAICDTFVSSLKILKTNKRENFYPVLTSYLQSEDVFIVRFAIVCLLSYYITENRVDEIVERIVKLQGRDYYIDMAIAWLISVVFVKCKTKILPLLRAQILTASVQNKSISKICDSYRVSAEDKTLVKQYRCKN